MFCRPDPLGSSFSGHAAGASRGGVCGTEARARRGRPLRSPASWPASLRVGGAGAQCGAGAGAWCRPSCCCVFSLICFFFFSCLCHFLPFAHTGWPVSSRGFALELRALPCAGGEGYAGLRGDSTRNPVSKSGLGKCDLCSSQVTGS